MHISRTTVRRNDKVYQYVRLVQSVRNAHGTPSHKVVANLSHWTPLQIENIERALVAARSGKQVVVQSPPAADLRPQVGASLEYLDVALALTLFRQCKLDVALDDLLGCTDTTVRPSDVVAALVTQRIVDPDSKLAAQRWLPNTALPELLHLPLTAFNNSRVHRTLDALEQIDEQLQQRVAHKCASQAAFATLYLDSTDTFFIGQGPDKATNGKTKEGRIERKVGVVLLCNERGEPLRWKVVEGRSADNILFRDVFDELKAVDWACDVPIVVDRAMGSTADIRAMFETGLKFVTALRATEFDSYTDRIPRTEIGALELMLNQPPADNKADLIALAKTVTAHGFEHIDDDLFVLDLGVRQAAHLEQDVLDSGGDVLSEGPETLQQALQLGRRLAQGLRNGEFANQLQAGKHYGYAKKWAQRRLALAQLPPAVQQDIERGCAEHVSLTSLASIARLPVERQHAAYKQLKQRKARTVARESRKRSSCQPHPPQPLPVRQVLYFCPSLHLQKRRTLNDHLDQAYAFVRNLNQDIAQGRTRSSKNRLAARVEQELTRLKLRKVFDVTIADDATIELTEVAHELKRLRGRYGFCFLIGHPDLVDTPEQLVELYRSKNHVEYDFRTIKSVLDLRPIHHHTDQKVTAHVTLCVLALLLLRHLDAKLQRANISAPTAVKRLASCRLNRIEMDDFSFYTVTKPTPEQRHLLQTLGLAELADDDVIEKQITPR